MWGQHSAALPSALTGICYPAAEQLRAPGKVWVSCGSPGCSILFEEKMCPTCHHLPYICLQVACAMKECLGPKSR